VAQRNMQGAADQAAFSAVIAASAGGGASPTTQAKGITASMGFVDGQAGVTVAVNNPPSQGNYTANNSAWEVIIQKPVPMWFTRLFLSSTPTASARAVALGSAGACVISLDPSAQQAVGVSGSGTLSMPCDLFVNSTNSDGTDLSGGASISAKDIYLTGNYKTSGGSSISATGTFDIGSAAIADPYTSRVMPTFSGCGSPPNGSASTYQSNGTIDPGVYCGGISVSGSGSLTMTAGVYILDRGDFAISGSGSVTATGGVTIILTSSTGSNYGKVNISGSGVVTTSAPTTGATAGMAFWIDKNAPSNNQANFSGGSTQNITGALYAPSQILNYSGGSSTGTSCSQLVARTFVLSGSATLKHTCSGLGLSEPPGSGGSVQMAE